MPWRMIPPQVAAAGYHHYSSNVVPVPHISLVSNLSRGQSDVQFAPSAPADFNQMHRMHSVSAARYNQLVDVPPARYELPPPAMAESVNRTALYHQQSFQQQIPYRPFASPHNLTHPFAVPSMPILAPQCIPACGIYPHPAVTPVFQQPLVQMQLNNDAWRHHGQVIAAVASQRVTSAAATSHSVAAATNSGLCDRRGIWPTAFGPFARPPQSSADSVNRRLPPGLESQVLGKIGVIGQRDVETQKSVSVECGDADSDSVSSDSQDSLSHRSSSELTLATCASQTAVCDSSSSSVRSLWHDSVEHQPGVPVQALSTANESSSLLVDSEPSANMQTVFRQKNTSRLPDMFTSEEEFKSLPCRPQNSHSYLPTVASESDNFVATFGSHSDVERTLKQTANTVCKMETGHVPSDAVDGTRLTDNRALLRDIIVQLSDMLYKPDELRFVDICNALYSKLTIGTSSSQDANIDGTLCESAVSISLTNPHSDEPFHSVTSAANRQNEESLVGRVDNRCSRTASHNSTCPTNMQTLTKSNHSHDSLVSPDTADADSQAESNKTDGVSSPAAQTSACSTVSATCTPAAATPDTLLPDVSSLCLSDTALLQRVLSKVAESRLRSFENDSDRHNKHASDSSVEDLLMLLQRWKSS